jgi:hypothetical protein
MFTSKALFNVISAAIFVRTATAFNGTGALVAVFSSPSPC